MVCSQLIASFAFPVERLLEAQRNLVRDGGIPQTLQVWIASLGLWLGLARSLLQLKVEFGFDCCARVISKAQV